MSNMPGRGPNDEHADLRARLQGIRAFRRKPEEECTDAVRELRGTLTETNTELVGEIGRLIVEQSSAQQTSVEAQLRDRVANSDRKNAELLAILRKLSAKITDKNTSDYEQMGETLKQTVAFAEEQTRAVAEKQSQLDTQSHHDTEYKVQMLGVVQKLERDKLDLISTLWWARLGIRTPYFWFKTPVLWTDPTILPLHVQTDEAEAKTKELMLHYVEKYRKAERRRLKRSWTGRSWAALEGAFAGLKDSDSEEEEFLEETGLGALVGY
jgi:hypothetical protein